MKSRLIKIYNRLKQQKVDALLITNSVNASYLGDLREIDAWALITPGVNYLLTDPRFAEISRSEPTNFKIRIDSSLRSRYKSLNKLSNSLKLNRLGFEANSLSYAKYKELKAELLSIDLVPTSNLVETLRAIKDSKEIRLIKKAISISQDIFNSIMNVIRPGIDEKGIAAQIEFFLRILGGDKSSFPPIVTSGKRTSLPHGCPTTKLLKRNEPILIDLGISLNGYNSDLTRMAFLGRISQRFKSIYNLLIKAQEKAISRIAPGVKACEVDRAARRYLNRYGLGKYFIHGLGHGVGREVHEGPWIFENNKAELKKGMVVTVEPAVYIPKWGGIRIEDMILVTSRGHEVLSKLSRKIVRR
jgi:Xaa-Pro aminopeptidase